MYYFNTTLTPPQVLIQTEATLTNPNLAQVPDEMAAIFIEHSDFVQATVEKGVVVALTVDEPAFEAWKATQTEPESELSLDEEISALLAENEQLKVDVTQSDLALTELFELLIGGI